MTARSLTVRPAHQDQLVDSPSGFVVEGCRPGEPLEIAAALSIGGMCFASEAVFAAGNEGTVDTGLDAPTSGSYLGADAFGLLWSGRAVGAASAAADAPATVELEVVAGDSHTRTAVTRTWLSKGATLTPIHAEGVHGLYARPAGEGPFPSVVAFGGSGGGLMGASMWAPLLASHGIATLAIAYFGLPGLPAELVGIEVEVVERAVRWLRARPETLTPVGVMGASRGSELALWSAVLLDDVASVVAFAPSGVSWPGFGAHGPVDAPAWTFRGEALPFPRIEERPDGPPTEPFALRPIFERALLDAASTEAATIPVEQAQGPILLVSGEADDMWPSAQMAEIIVARASSATSVEHLRYTGAGHTCGGPPGMPSGTSVRHPVDGGFYAFGGSETANAAARAEAWPRVIEHLRAGANREEEAALSD